jgi:hypothetical protein
MREPNSSPTASSDPASAPTAKPLPYSPPTLVKLGELKDLTANGSFFGDT